MAFPVLETPHTELPDQTRLGDLDFSTENSIPSPSKEHHRGGNDLLKQIQGMRAQEPQQRKPLNRLPGGDRRNNNGASKNEFTPLLKSATHNNRVLHSSSRFPRNGGYLDKENASKMKTPQALRASYRDESPALPLNSSVIQEEDTGSNADMDNTEDPAPPPVSSSSVSTPMTTLPRRGEGPLDHGGNMATLREQEAKLEQIDKENFSLKLKIHFLEEALRRSGKDFNEAALKENTDLKVDKISLQRDLKHYRAQLRQAEKDLEAYKRQLLDYAEKMKRKHASQEIVDELDQLRKTVSEKEAEVEDLRADAGDSDQTKAELEKLRDEISDLEATVRDKDRQLDEKDDELDKIRGDDPGSEVEELRETLQERDGDLRNLQDDLKAAREETNRKIEEKNQHIAQNENQISDLHEELDGKRGDLMSSIRQKDEQIEKLREEIDDLHERLEDAVSKLADVDQLQRKLETAETNHGVELRKKSRALEDKDHEIYTLEQKLESAEGRDQDAEDLQDNIQDLEAEIREKERSVEERDQAIGDLKEKLQHLEEDSDEELLSAQDRIQELEEQQKRHMQELQKIREDQEQSTFGRSQNLQSAEARIAELENQQQSSDEHEKELQKEMHRLQSEIQELEHDLEESNNKADEEVARLEQDKRALESAKSRAEDQVNNLEQTITRLREAEGNLSGKELALQQILDTERQHFETERSALQKDLDEAQDTCESQRKSLRENDAKLKSLHTQLENAKSRETELQDRVQSLEDELEVLQSTLDDEANRANDEVDAAKSEAEGLRRQLAGLRKDLAEAQAENADSKAESETLKITAAMHRRSKTPSPVSRQTPAFEGRAKQEQEVKISELETRVQDLTTQLTRARKDRTDTQSKLFASESTLQSARAELGALQLKAADATPTADRHSRSQQLQNRLTDTQAQLSRTNKEKRSLEDSLASTTAELSALKSMISDLESERENARDSVRDMRSKTQTRERESEKKFQSQVVRYERDIQNLEQDLEDADEKAKDREDKVQGLEGELRGLRKKSKELERRLQAQSQRQAGGSAEGTTDVPVTKEEMDNLRLELEDADAQMSSLQTHLQSTKLELVNETSRSKDLATQLKESRKDTTSLLKQSQAQAQHQQTVPAVDLADVDHEKATAQLKQRHRAELSTLARQIEFLTAAYRREQGFRLDLAFTKREWFDKVLKRRDGFVERDLKIVRGMGVDTDAVKEGLKGRRIVSDREGMAHRGGTRRDLQLDVDVDVDDQEIAIPIDSLRPSSRTHPRPPRSQQPRYQLAQQQGNSSKALAKLRPGLKAVRAIVRMQVAARRWKGVTSRHDEILAKLAQRPGKGANIGDRKISTGAVMNGVEKGRKVSVLGKRK